jgi:hypothetical protein
LLLLIAVEVVVCGGQGHFVDQVLEFKLIEMFEDGFGVLLGAVPAEIEFEIVLKEQVELLVEGVQPCVWTLLALWLHGKWVRQY